MNERIKELEALTMSGGTDVHPVQTKYDRMDLLLPEEEKNVKRICEYILNQCPLLTKYSSFTGFFRFDGSVIGDIFNRSGHPNTDAVMSEFYCKHIDNLSAMDWQHSTSDYRKVLKVGIVGIIKEIDLSLSKHTDPEKISFLKSLKKIAQAFILWMKKCSALTSDFAKSVAEPEYRKNLEVKRYE